MRAVIMLAACALLVSPALAGETEKSDSPGAGKDKMICKRETPIGSLIASRKRCMTKGQWDKLSQDHNDELRRMQMELATKPSGR